MSVNLKRCAVSLGFLTELLVGGFNNGLEVLMFNVLKDPEIKGPVVLLVDADVLVHKVSRAAEKTVRWPNGVWTWWADEEEANLIYDTYINDLKEKLNADEVIMCLSHDHNFRYEVFAEYKSGRRTSDSYPPMLKQYIREKMSSEFTTYIVDGLEADDVLGMLLTNKSFRPGATKILCTIDKDLDTVPGVHYNLDREELYDVPLDYADYRFYLQALMGDRTDGIPGCPGYGDKTAEKLLVSTPKEDWWKEIVKAYEKKGLTADYAVVMARLVRILRHGEFDKKALKPILWNPIV